MQDHAHTECHKAGGRIPNIDIGEKTRNYIAMMLQAVWSVTPSHGFIF